MGVASLIRTIQTGLCISSILATGSTKLNFLYLENNAGMGWGGGGGGGGATAPPPNNNMNSILKEKNIAPSNYMHECCHCSVISAISLLLADCYLMHMLKILSRDMNLQ